MSSAPTPRSASEAVPSASPDATPSTGTSADASSHPAADAGSHPEGGSHSEPVFVIEGLHVCAVNSPGGEETSNGSGTSGGGGAGGAAAGAAHILKGVDLKIGAGELHALMGPNGSGKSTLAATLMGSPEYRITDGSVRFKGTDITDWGPDERAKSGLFLAFQYPQAIVGVSVLNFLRQSMTARTGTETSILQLRMKIMEWMERLQMDPSFADRFINDGFSGGEKKRNEILQMAILQPEMAILDETDSGLDIDALKVVAEGVGAVAQENPRLGVLAITHYRRLLDYLTPDYVHILLDGRIVEVGDISLAHKLERRGYGAWR